MRAPSLFAASAWLITVLVVRVILIAWLVATWAPGFGELLEDTVCFALDGVTDHSEDEEPCREHGCTPTAHHCSCCASAVVTEPPRTDPSLAPAVLARAIAWPRHERAPAGVVRPLLRPPTA